MTFWMTVFRNRTEEFITFGTSKRVSEIRMSRLWSAHCKQCGFGPESENAQYFDDNRDSLFSVEVDMAKNGFRNFTPLQFTPEEKPCSKK